MRSAHDFPPDPDAPTAKLYTLRATSWTGPEPVADAWVRPVGARARFAYRIVDVVDGARGACLYRLRCERHPIAAMESLPPDTLVYHWQWSNRGRRRRSTSKPLL